jgi:hypothetical protein
MSSSSSSSRPTPVAGAPVAGAPGGETEPASEPDEVEKTAGSVARLQSILNLALESTAVTVVDSQRQVHDVKERVDQETTTHLPASDSLLDVCVKSFRNSEPGDGKDQLDAHFSHVAAHLKRMMNKGDVQSVTDATSMTDLLGGGGSLRETQLGVICYDRAKNHHTDPVLPRIANKSFGRFRQIRKLADGSLRLHEVTGLGEGVPITKEECARMWPNANGEVTAGQVPSFFSTYVATAVHGDKKAHIRVLKGDISKNKKKKRLKKRLSKRKKQLRQKTKLQNKQAAGQEAAGLYRCPVVNEAGARCKCVYTSQKWFLQHKRKTQDGLQQHNFGTAFDGTMTTKLADVVSNSSVTATAIASNPQTTVGRTSLSDMLKFSGRQRVKEGPLPPPRGICRQSAVPVPKVYKTKYQIAFLKEQFENGIKGAQGKEKKVSAAQCRKKMSDKVDSDGTKFFGPRKKEHGGVLREQQIKAYFSSLAAARKNAKAAGLNANEAGACGKKKKRTRKALDEGTALRGGVLPRLGTATAAKVAPHVPTFGDLARMSKSQIETACHKIGGNLKIWTARFGEWRAAMRVKFSMEPVAEGDELPAENNVVEYEGDEEESAASSSAYEASEMESEMDGSGSDE